MSTANLQGKKSIIRLSLALVLLAAASLACALPFSLPFQLGGGLSGGSLEEQLDASGLLIEEVTIVEDQVTIEYAVSPDDDPEVMVSGWLSAFAAAAKAEPGADSYTLLANLDGEPYLEVRASGLDLVGYLEEDITLEEFLDRLEISDLRPAAERLAGVLIEGGLDLIEVRKSGSGLVVEYYPAAAESQAQLLEEWWGILSAAADTDPTLETLQIRAVMLDTSVFVVEGDLGQVRAYSDLEISPLQFMAGLVITEEPVVLEEE